MSTANRHRSIKQSSAATSVPKGAEKPSSKPSKQRRPSRVGRPTPDRSVEIGRTILTAATQCFLVNGYAGASMDAVAATARVSKETLYARYRNKETLLRAVIGDQMAMWSAESSKQDWRAGNTLEQRLCHHARVVMTWAAAKEVRAMEGLLGTAPPSMSREIYQVLYNSFIEFLASEIDASTRAEGRPAKNPRKVAYDLIALFAGWFRIESNVSTIKVSDAIDFSQHAVGVMLAARALW